MSSYTSYVPLNSYIYISHLDEDYQFWRLPSFPDTVSDQMQSSFASTNVLGRTAPVYTYSNSGPRTVSFDLSLHRDLMDDINEGYSNANLGPGEDYTDSLIRALQSISVPKYNTNNKAVEPPLVAIRLGDEIFIKGVVNSSIQLSYKKPIIPNRNGKGERYAAVSLVLTISEVDPYDATTVFQNGSFRGVVNSLRHGMNLGEASE